MLSHAGLPEVPCAECGTRVRGLQWGDRCAECRARRSRRASRVAGRAALIATVLAALYVVLRLRPAAGGDPLPLVYGGIAILTTYVLVRRIVARVAFEFLPD